MPESWFVQTLGGVRALLAPEDAEVLLFEAGRRTALYVARVRIPRLARLGLSGLPRGLALRALAGAIRRHAWTFVGGGECRIDPAFRSFELKNAPTCRLACGCSRGGSYYSGAFQTLITALVCPGIEIAETACELEGAPSCRFELHPSTPSAKN
ncbi:MAG: bacteriochlorophyll 4-vinyl reductase [Myxococcales bacterium]|nr:bacteriochlorophyll 4-vinyl reductase [Myxococcales bacterium]